MNEQKCRGFKTIDLHIHTTASDGTDTPEELVEKVCAAGIELFSVTDHDTVFCTGVIPEILRAYGQKAPLFINGIEFSCKKGSGDKAKKYHILGYGFDPGNQVLKEVLQKGREFRMQKAVKRLDYLKEEYGFIFPKEEVDEYLAMNSPAKPHLADMMVRHDYARDINDAVKNYINKRKFENVNLLPEEAIRGILAAGGIPVLAHPPFGDGDDDLSGEILEERVTELIGYGLRGLEGYYSEYTDARCAEVLSLAEKYGLYVTAGSDYHGEKKKHIRLGLTNLRDASAGPAGLRRFIEDVRKA